MHTSLPEPGAQNRAIRLNANERKASAATTLKGPRLPGMVEAPPFKTAAIANGLPARSGRVFLIGVPLPSDPGGRANRPTLLPSPAPAQTRPGGRWNAEEIGRVRMRFTLEEED